MKHGIWLVGACLLAAPATAGDFFSSVEDRVAAVQQQVRGKNDYQAHLAREFANIADEEKSQHDVAVARYFIALAEKAAARAGGGK